MTSSESIAMFGRKEEGFRQGLNRPALVSKNSNSVPSTPHQQPRVFATRSRSPSPNAALGSHSPRSVSSEANGSMPSLRKPRSAACQYETSLAFGKRRMPYSIGDKPLEKFKEEVKQKLDPDEESRLSADMQELYKRLLPSEESDQRRTRLVQKLESILKKEWPGNDFKVHVFGSSGNLLCTSESDVDICIQTPMRKLETMHMLAEALAKNGMSRVVCVASAKVPIVKIWDPELKLACDMNVNNTLALENTRMIKTYVQIDDRVRPLAMIVKHWTKERILNDAAFGGTLSSYTWICMILNFLQTRNPPILPSLHRSSARTIASGTTLQSEFADDLEALRGFGARNKESLGQLLFEFFKFYGHDINYDASVVSVRHGKILSRKEKGWHVENLVKEGHDRLCVEEPFNVTRNLGNSADDTAFRGIHLELRRAFDLIANGGQLDKACEQYEYPPEEKMTFKRPTATKTTLTHSTPSSTRGGRSAPNTRGARGPTNIKGSHAYGRRASSGTNFGTARSPYIQNPAVGGSGQEYFMRGLHDHLFQQYQILEMQSNNLKAQLFAQSQAQQQAQQAQHAQQAAHIHAQMQAQAHAIAQAQAQAHAHAQAYAASVNGGSPQKSGYTTSRSSPRISDSALATGSLGPGYLYHYPQNFENGVAMSPSLSQEGARTNPTSPSLVATLPNLRRAIHRSSAATDMPNGSIRSHSQPARRNMIPQFFPPGYPVPALPPGHYLQPGSGATTPMVAQDAFSPPATADPIPPIVGRPAETPKETLPAQQGKPKEYLGYYMGELPKSAPQNFTVPPIPSWTEIENRQRQRKTATDMSQMVPGALGPGFNRRLPRSPSPLRGHFRSLTTEGGFRSAPLPDAPNAQEQSEIYGRLPENGLLIVNGSYSSGKVSQQPSPQLGAEPFYEAKGDLDTMPYDKIFSLELPETRQRQLAASSFHHTYDGGDMDYLHHANNLSHIAQGPPAATASGSAPTPRPNGPVIVSSTPSVELSPRIEQLSLSTNGVHQDENSAHGSLADSKLQRRSPPNGLSPLDVVKAKELPTLDSKLTGVGPLLSPVLETRTPSPTASRVLEARQLQGKAPLSVIADAKKLKQPVTKQPKPDLGTSKPSVEQAATTSVQADATTEPKSAVSNSGAQQNQWQKSGPRKTRKKSKNQGGSANAEAGKAHGETVPTNATERKGG